MREIVNVTAAWHCALCLSCAIGNTVFCSEDAPQKEKSSKSEIDEFMVRPPFGISKISDLDRFAATARGQSQIVRCAISKTQSAYIVKRHFGTGGSVHDISIFISVGAGSNLPKEDDSCQLAHYIPCIIRETEISIIGNNLHIDGWRKEKENIIVIDLDGVANLISSE